MIYYRVYKSYTELRCVYDIRCNIVYTILYYTIDRHTTVHCLL